MRPKEGSLTYAAEGNNIPTSRYYSRVIHWPGSSIKCTNEGSGVTLGCGYDMKYRSPAQIKSDLTASGIPLEKAETIAKGSGKSYCEAERFVKENKNIIGEITETQQLRLFELTYKSYIRDSA